MFSPTKRATVVLSADMNILLMSLHPSEHLFRLKIRSLCSLWCNQRWKWLRITVGSLDGEVIVDVRSCCKYFWIPGCIFVDLLHACLDGYNTVLKLNGSWHCTAWRRTSPNADFVLWLQNIEPCFILQFQKCYQSINVLAQASFTCLWHLVSVHFRLWRCLLSFRLD